jgi:hypothetical protein
VVRPFGLKSATGGLGLIGNSQIDAVERHCV